MEIPDNEVQIDQPESIDPSEVKTDQPESQEIPNNEMQTAEPSTDYGSTEQQVLTGLEGAGQGFLGPVSTALEMGLNKAGVPNFTPEDIEGRKQTNPVTHGIAEAAGLGTGFLTGAGEAGLVAKAGNLLNVGKEAGLAMKVGSTAIKGAVETGLIQAGDEISKALLGKSSQDGDHVGAIATAMAIGGILGVPTGLASASLDEIASSKLTGKATKLLEDFGDRWSQVDDVGTATNPTTTGGKLADALRGNMSKISDKVVRLATEGALSAAGFAKGGMEGLATGWITAKTIEPLLSKALGKPLQKLSMNAVSAVVKMLGEGDVGDLEYALKYAKHIDKGEKLINSSVESLFKPGRQAISDYATDKDRKNIEDWLNKGVSTDQEESGYAEGGMVKPNSEDSLSKHYPTQSLIANAAKSRISQYLTGLKPQKNPSKLPFDRQPDNTDKERSYKSALDVAAKPMAIMDDVRTGALSAEKMKHFTQMYPELHQQLSKKITERATSAQLDEEKPPYKTRMAMSMFLGSALDSTMTPAGIQAAQATYIKPAPPQQQGKTKRGTSTLGKSNSSYRTPNQTAEADQSKRD